MILKFNKSSNYLLHKKPNLTNNKKFDFSPYIVEEGNNVNLNMYDAYIYLYAQSGRSLELKKRLNWSIPRHVPSIELVLEEMKKARDSNDVWYSSMALNKLNKLLERQVNNLKENPIFVNEYTFLGNSSRVLVKNYGKHITGTKGVIKNMLFRELNKNSSELVKIGSDDPDTGYSYLEVDLQSAFASLVIQLFPKLYPLNKEAVSFGLWSYIEKNYFHKGGFNKKFVKICVYSSYFGGGKTAFISGILNKTRDSLGLTPAEWRELPAEVINPLIIEAEYISEVMYKCPLLVESRSASVRLSRIYYHRTMVCPTGHVLPEHFFKPDDVFKIGDLNRKVWSSNFSLFLQSYEQIIVQQTFILISSEMSEEELVFIASYHDGAIIRVKDNMKGKLETLLNVATKEICNNLGFDKPISWDLKPF